jgi:release factor glutamine methyltransferase
MDLQQAQRELVTELSPLYGGREASLIADWVMEKLTGRKRIDRLLYPSEPLPAPLLEQYKKYRAELLAHRPVQYVLQESWFCGMKFYVDERVLIPRPETEELVEWVAQTIAADTGAPAQPIAPSRGALLDVGTGSGCIAIALRQQLPTLEVHACDTSRPALDVAQRNATQLNTDIHFHHLDFLNSGQWESLPQVQWLVSNPPYIPLNEKASMASHVTESEPALALFVPDTDPLVFYRALGEFARQKLLPGGSIFVEIHEDLAPGTLDVFKTAGFQQVILQKDMQGKDRMIKAS